MHRTRMGTGPCGGVGCAMRAASILGEERDWSPRRTLDEARAFLQARYAARRPALRGDQARMELASRDVLSVRTEVGTPTMSNPSSRILLPRASSV